MKLALVGTLIKSRAFPRRLSRPDIENALAGCGGGVGLDGRPNGRDFEQTVDGAAFLFVELSAELGGVDVGLALRGRHVAYLVEGAADGVLTVLGQAPDRSHGAADLLALGGGQALHEFVTLQHLSALLFGHLVEQGEALMQLLLLQRGKIAEAGLILKGALLLGEREVAVGGHPAGEMELGLSGTVGRDQGHGGLSGGRGSLLLGGRLGGPLLDRLLGLGSLSLRAGCGFGRGLGWRRSCCRLSWLGLAIQSTPGRDVLSALLQRALTQVEVGIERTQRPSELVLDLGLGEVLR